MKKSELRKIIKEEISKTIKENDDWDFEESIERIIGELKEYNYVNPSENLQIAIDHLRKSIG